MSVAGWITANLFRWFPHAAPTGLFPVGTPGDNSPVIVTANFSLTVERARRALENRDVWLLVANSDGINVWCAACGGIFTENRVIDAIKVSGLADRVKHREVILPALSAPGIDRGEIQNETGFHARFGPVHAKDIPAYLDADRKKDDNMRRFRFDLGHRLDMMISMNFLIYLVLAAVLAIFWRHLLPGATLLFWSATVFLFLFINVIPGRTGWSQSLFTSGFLIFTWAVTDWFLL